MGRFPDTKANKKRVYVLCDSGRELSRHSTRRERIDVSRDDEAREYRASFTRGGRSALRTQRHAQDNLFIEVRAIPRWTPKKNTAGRIQHYFFSLRSVREGILYLFSPPVGSTWTRVLEVWE